MCVKNINVWESKGSEKVKWLKNRKNRRKLLKNRKNRSMLRKIGKNRNLTPCVLHWTANGPIQWKPLKQQIHSGESRQWPTRTCFPETQNLEVHRLTPQITNLVDSSLCVIYIQLFMVFVVVSITQEASVAKWVTDLLYGSGDSEYSSFMLLLYSKPLLVYKRHISSPPANKVARRKVMFSLVCVSVMLSWGGSHVTITHDDLGLTIQGGTPPLYRTPPCRDVQNCST